MITRLPLRVARDDHALVAALLAILAMGYVVAVSATMGRISYNTWSALLVVPLLGGLSLMLLRRFAYRTANAALIPLLTLAFISKAIGCAVRYYVTFGVYDGQADATNYHEAASALSRHFRNGQFDVPLGGGSASTQFMKVVTGVVYTVIGPSRSAGFFVFSVASFWGLYLAFRAFQIAMPNGATRRYAVLVFFLPSLLFWPSSIGKEAWMIFTLGMAAYGAARAFTHRRWGYIPLVLGLVGALMVRPHVAVVIAVGMGTGYLVRPRRGQGMFGGRAGKAIGIAGLFLVGVVGAGRVQDALRLDDSGSLTQALDVAELRTTQGGSSFDPARVNSVLDVPWATVTVLFRPFPYEASSAQAFVSSIEGLVLIGLFVLSWPRLARLPGLATRNPYVAFAAVYTLVFVFAFSTFGNFGIITRQRVQLFPFVLVLLCVPRVITTERETRRPRHRVAVAR